VRDEDRLLSIVDEEAQSAGGRVQVNLEHHSHYAIERLVAR
jgi:hypothetical protein